MPIKDNGNWGQLASIGFEVAVGVGLGVAVGYWVDKRFGCEPWGTIVGAMVGLAGGMYLFIREGIRINKD